jgi:hypothetical protein
VGSTRHLRLAAVTLCMAGFATARAAGQDRTTAAETPRVDVAAGFTMQTPADVNQPPQCQILSLPCLTPRTFPDFGLSLSAAGYLDHGVAIVGEADLFDNTWYTSATKEGKQDNVVRLVLTGVRGSVVPPAVGGRKAQGVRLFGQVLAGYAWSSVQAGRAAVQPGAGIDAKLSGGPTIRIQVDYDIVAGTVRNLSGSRVFVGLVGARSR